MQLKEKTSMDCEIQGNCDTSRPYCFISYSSRDSASVHYIVKSLMNEGYNTWVDLELEKHIGEEWDRIVEEVILDFNCKCILWFVSSNSCKSGNVAHELEFANSSRVFYSHNQRSVRIYPIEIEKISSSNDIKLFIKNLIENTDDKDQCSALRRIDSLIKDNKVKRLSVARAFLPTGIKDLTESLKFDGLEDVVQNPIFRLHQEYLKDFFRETRDDNNEILVGGIDEELLPKLRSTEEENNEYTIEDIITLNQNDTFRLMLVGEGGSGKTTSLAYIMKKLSSRNLVAVHVPLSQINDNTTIFEYVKCKLFPRESNYPAYIDEFMKSDKMVYLLDGLNEINPQKGWIIANQMRSLLNDNSNVLVTTRHSVNIQPTFKEIYDRCKLYNIVPLSEQSIRKYLESNGVKAPKKIPKVITSPLMLRLYVSLEKEKEKDNLDLVYENNESRFAMRRRTSEAALIWNYLLHEVKKAYEIDEIEMSFFSIFYVAPYLAWEMASNKSMSLSRESFKRILEKAKRFYYKCFRRDDDLDESFFDSQVAIYDYEKINYDEIFKFLIRRGLIVCGENSTYSFFHQAFRDCLAAIHCVHEIRLYPHKDAESLSKSILAKEILVYISNLEIKLVEDYWKNLCRIIELSPNSYTIMNLTLLFNEYKDGKLGKVSFKRKDLSKVSLNSFVFVDGESSSSFRNAIISEQTFAPPVTHKDIITSIVASKDFRYIVSGDKSGRVIIYDTERAQPIQNKDFSEEYAPIKKILIVENKLFVCCANGFVFRFNFANGTFDEQTIFYQPNEKSVLTGVCCAFDNIFMIINGEVYCKEIGKGDPICCDVSCGDKKINCLAVDGGEQYIYCGSEDGTIYVLDGNDGEVEMTVDVSKECNDIFDLLYSNDNIYILGEDGRVVSWSLKENKANANFKWDSIGARDVEKICVTPRGDCLITASSDGNLARINAITGKVEHYYKFSATNGIIHSVCISSDGKYIVSDGENYTPVIRGVWEQNIPYGDFNSSLSREVVSINVSNNGKNALVHSKLSQGIESIIWDLENGQPVFVPINVPSLWSNAKAITNDGKIVFFGQGEKLGFFNLTQDSSEELKLVEPFKGWMFSIMLDEKNRLAWIGSDNRRIYRLNLLDASLRDISSPFENTINCFCLSASDHVYAGDWGGKIYKLDQDMNIISSTTWQNYSDWIIDIDYDEAGYVFVGLDNGYIIKLDSDLKDVATNWEYNGKRRWDKPGIVSLTTNGEKLIALANDNCAFVLNKETLELEKTVDLKVALSSVCIARTAQQVKKSSKFIVGDESGDILIYDIDKEKVINKFHRIKNVCLVGCDFRGVDFTGMEALRDELKGSGAIV